jgi:hypothetical protein
MSKLVLIVEDSETCAETLQIALELIPGVEVRSIHSSTRRHRNSERAATARSPPSSPI